ncbi:MAG TPA: hypothetical protein VF238_11055 [Methylomirabilota bacterium]
MTDSLVTQFEKALQAALMGETVAPAILKVAAEYIIATKLKGPSDKAGAGFREGTDE